VEHEKHKVFIEPEADRRLAGHIEFLARVSESAAYRILEAYEEALAFLESSPEICPIYSSGNQVDAQLRYKLFGKRYRIVFEIVDNSVYVYDIQDCRQSAERNLL